MNGMQRVLSSQTSGMNRHHRGPRLLSLHLRRSFLPPRRARPLEGSPRPPWPPAVVDRATREHTPPPPPLFQRFHPEAACRLLRR